MTAAPGIEVALTGRLGRQPEPRTTRAGNPMLVLSLAVEEVEAAGAAATKRKAVLQLLGLQSDFPGSGARWPQQNRCGCS